MRLRATLALVLLGLAGCSSILDYSPRSALDEEADYLRTLSSYRELSAKYLATLKYADGLTAPQISPLRKSHALAFADWMACISGEAEQTRRIFAIFFRDKKVTDFRLAVAVDQCEQEAFEPLPK